MSIVSIRNPHIVRALSHPKWGRLAEPIFATDNVNIARAQSLLTGEMLCGQVCPPLTPEQARDVLRWAGVLS